MTRGSHVSETFLASQATMILDQNVGSCLERRTGDFLRLRATQVVHPSWAPEPRASSY